MNAPVGIHGSKGTDFKGMPQILALAAWIALVLLIGIFDAVAQAAVVRQPYLQLVTPTSVTVVWRTDLNSANNSRVQYGTTAGILNQEALGTAVIPGSNSNVKDHMVTITGLTPDTLYFYNVGTVTDGVQGGGTSNHFFRTAPQVGASMPFRAWVLGDSGTGGVNQALVRDAMLNETSANPPAPNFIIHAGDIAYGDGTDLEFTDNHFAVYQDILRHTPLWPTLGNHEARSVNTSLGIGPYYESHVLPASAEAGGVASGTEAYYAFDYANAHFIVLDSMDSDRTPGGAMLTWLENDLASTIQEWVIVFFHHPPYTKGDHDSDNANDSGGRLIDMREQVLPILEAGGVDLVITGHSHSYERSYLIDGVYGYGSAPDFVTPPFNTLFANGNILDPGDGNPAGNGAYQKLSGGNSNNGTVYMVAGHGGQNHAMSRHAGGDHPVMYTFDINHGSVLLDIEGTTLKGRNVRAGGAITDSFAIQKNPPGTNLPPNGLITSPSVPRTISVGESVSFTGQGMDPDGHLPLTHHWHFGAGSGIPDATVEDPGAVTFNNPGVFTVTYTVTDALGLSDPTPPTIQVTVQSLSITNLAAGSGKPYVVSTLQPGELVYIDRDFTFTSVPAGVQGARYIRTANDDKSSTGTNFLSFDVNEPVRVYVAYDLRISPPPSWFADFTDTGLDLVSTDVPLRLLAKSFPAGTVTLGGNRDGGSGNSMYAVVILPDGSGGGGGLSITNLTVGSGKPYVVAPGLQTGELVYIDRDFTFTSVPAGVQGAQYIRTANGDKSSTGTNFLSFDVNEPVRVYVAYDLRISPPPSWFADFTDTGLDLVSTDVPLRLLVKSFAAGTITLGGNRDGGSGNSMYAVIILPEGSGGGGGNQAPNGVIDTPSGDQVIFVGESVTFSGTGTDPDGHLPLTHHWHFGTGSGISDATVEDPGAVTFNNPGVFTVTYTVTDALGLSDPTPPTVQITVQSSSSSSLVISNLMVASGKPYVVAAGLQPGELVYIDRDFTFTSVPAGVQGAQYIRTANNDKSSTGTNFLSFDVNEPVTVYVAYDLRITPPPSWFADFTDTGVDLVSTDVPLRLLAKSFPAGTVTLGGNRDGGSGNSMYAVVILPEGNSGGGDPAPTLNITNLTVASGKPYVVAAGLQSGELVYIDRDFTFTSVPAGVQGAQYIRTANNDKSSTGTNFLSFDVNEPVTVYVAYDLRITPPPSWFADFTDTGVDLVSTDVPLRLLGKSFPAGTVTLGGNRDGGSGNSMYAVIIQAEES